MINFEFGQLRSDYVFITKITRDYVYVVCDRNLAPYGVGETATHFGHEVRKVSIHGGVYARFIKYNTLREFSTPRLATLNYYGTDIISMELQEYNYIDRSFDDAQTWVSKFDQAIPLIEKRIKYYVEKGFDVFMNGETIFWTKKHTMATAESADNDSTYVNLNPEGSLRLYYARAIKLFRIGIPQTKSLDRIREMNNHRNGEAQQQNLEENDSAVIGGGNVNVPILNGKMIAFVPNPQAPKEQQVLAFSPILESKQVRSASGGMRTVNHEERAAYSIGSKSNPTYVNVDFALNSAKIIGKHYGNEAMDFLDIPSILKNTGVVNLKRLSPNSRKNMPINRTALDCIAWLLGYIYREKSLSVLQDLNKAFRFTMTSGFIRESDIDVTKYMFKEDGERRELKSRTDMVNSVINTLHDNQYETHFERLEAIRKDNSTFLGALHGTKTERTAFRH